jgi:hypothetical protein
MFPIPKRSTPRCWKNWIGGFNAVSGRIDATVAFQEIVCPPIHWAGMCQKKTFPCRGDVKRGRRISRNFSRLGGLHQAPELVSFDNRHCYFLIVALIFQSHSFADRQKVDIQQPIAWGISEASCSTMRELTRRATGSMMTLGARHFLWYRRLTSFQKTTAIPAPGRPLDGPSRHQMGERCLKASHCGQ